MLSMRLSVDFAALHNYLQSKLHNTVINGSIVLLFWYE